ncbi:MAG: hypothetical protein K2L89_05320 [Muribaculaceae bacterium]|nr:hypothetical protein [Muribaculaceae bacterium]
MKKFLLIILLLIPIGLLVSCSDDVENPKEESNATVTLIFNNVAVVNGKIYTTQDYPLEIESVKLNNPDAYSKGIYDVEYMIDGHSVSKSNYAPFTGRIDTRVLSTGTHPLGVYLDIIEGDNTQTVDNMEYNFIVVPSVDDIPMDAQLGTFTQTFHVV